MVKRFWCLAAMATAVGLVCGLSWAAGRPLDPFGSGSSRGPRQEDAGVIASAEFINSPVTTIFKMVSDLTGYTIVTSPQVSAKPPQINLWIRNLTPDQVLEEVAALGGLVMERSGRTIRVMYFDEYASLYGVEKRVVKLDHANPREVADLLKPFAAEEDQARIVPDETRGQLILLLPEHVMESVLGLVRSVDVRLKDEAIDVLGLKHTEATRIVPIIEGMLGGAVRGKVKTAPPSAGKEGPPTGEAYRILVLPEPRLNVVLVRGVPEDVAKVKEFVGQLDQPAGITTVAYSLKHTTADNAQRILEELLQAKKSGDKGEARFMVVPNDESNQVIVQGSAKDHECVADVIGAFDQPLPPGGGDTRVYRLENATSSEVAHVLNELVKGLEETAGVGRRRKLSRGAGIRRAGDALFGGQLPSADRNGQPQSHDGTPEGAGGSKAQLPLQISDVPEINAVVIRASAAEHAEFAEIIRQLDTPRDQVLLEVTLVVVRSDEVFDLGIDLSGARLEGSGTQGLAFTTFGIGAPDLATGIAELAAPLFGANLAVFEPGDYSLVLRALETVGQVYIASIPKILVEDNAEAEISQISQEPFEVTSQGGDTTVTSFGGFVDAGTLLTVRPHVSEGAWLRLEYLVNLGAFGARTAAQLEANLPPPRRESQLQGTVRVPDGHVVVLGGLVGKRDEESVDRVPLLSEIPVLGELFKTRSNSKVNDTLFVFIRPVVVRDPAFRDLLYLSKTDIEAAKLRQRDYPWNRLKLLHMAPSHEEN
jgi:general secretion pathway protein D